MAPEPKAATILQEEMKQLTTIDKRTFRKISIEPTWLTLKKLIGSTSYLNNLQVKVYFYLQVIICFDSLIVDEQLISHHKS